MLRGLLMWRKWLKVDPDSPLAEKKACIVLIWRKVNSIDIKSALLQGKALKTDVFVWSLKKAGMDKIMRWKLNSCENSSYQPCCFLRPY